MIAPSGSVAAAVAVVAVAAAIVLAAAFVVYRTRQSDLKAYDLTTRAVRLYELGSAVEVDKARVPATPRGGDFSYSFWLEVDAYDATGAHRVVFARAVEGDAGVLPGDRSVGMRMSPLVVLDKDANRLHVLLRTTASRDDGAAGAVADVADVVEDPTRYGWTMATVAYLPLQRWVNVAFAVRGGKLTLYLDGDVYTVENTAFLNNKPAAAAAGAPAAGVLPEATRGSVFVGMLPGAAAPAAKPIPGVLTKLRFYNYALGNAEAKAVYLEGPVQRTLTTRIGLPAYGVQAPVYRTDRPGSDEAT